MAVNRDVLRIERELHALTSQILDAQTRALVGAWATAYDQVRYEIEAAATELAAAARNGRVTRTMVIRNQRAQAALDAVTTTLTRLAEQVPALATSDLLAALQASAAAEHGMISAQLAGTLRAELRAGLIHASPEQLLAIMTRTTGQITALSWPLATQASAAIRRELLRGIAVGDNPRAAARRMVRGIEDRFDGGLPRALVIARTEMLDAMRAAAHAVDQANADVLAGWKWLAHLDARTCRSCIAMHGQRFDLEVAGPLDHQQGRCARVPVTKTWAELGFTGIPEPADLTPDADAWFDGLTADQQRAILGRDGYEAWKAGRWPRDQWARRRETDGWRDSYVPATAPRAAVPA